MKGRVGTSGEDRISILPESLLCHILSFLTTKDSVKTSVLSSRWKNLWLWVPRLDLNKSDFSGDNPSASFIDKFLNFQGESYLRGFKLNTDHDVNDTSPLETCLMRVVKCKIQHFEIQNYFQYSILMMPLIFSMCDTLVSLKLSFVILSDLESFSLPCLKIMHFKNVVFPSKEAAEALISCSPVLKDLKMSYSTDDFEVLRVCSTSLKTFTLKQLDIDFVDNVGHKIVIDTPRLEYLNLKDYQCRSFKIVNMSESVKVDIDIIVRGGSIIFDFLTCLSNVRYITISRRSLRFIYLNQEINPRFKFHDLARLRTTMFSNSSPEMLPVILEMCPNLKHLTLDLQELVHYYLVTEGISGLLSVLPRCLISSLEYVDIESPITEKATELKLVSYFLENSTTLKKLVLHLNHSCGEKHDAGLLKQLFESPRASSVCQLVIVSPRC
ncbi:FBD-associated F-box protein [Cardamine amara subsp. amara]|uniref:FBD-associated F-box protein n=1 Tax=Cardamine amara subsp. amara TaxID=228776 RepID=A0ABD0ZME0_CARAN